MQKHMWIAVLLLLGSTTLTAQLPKALIYANTIVAAPSTKDFANEYKTGFGAEAGVGFGFGKTLLVGSIGYLTHSPVNSNNTKGAIRVLPVKVGVRRYLIGKLFVAGQIGLAMQSLEKSNVKGSPFMYEVSTGIKVLKLLDIGVAYHSFRPEGFNYNAGTVLYKAGFSFKL